MQCISCSGLANRCNIRVDLELATHDEIRACVVCCINLVMCDAVCLLSSPPVAEVQFVGTDVLCLG